MKTCRLGCGKMLKGGKVTGIKKMSKGGYAPAQTGGDNVKMGIYGIPNAGRTDALGFKKGGIKKAKFGQSVNVQPGKIGKVVGPDRGYKNIGEREPDRLSFPTYKKGGAKSKSAKFAALAPPKNKITFADKIAGAKKRTGKKK